jgi:two-component system copper resistance phosphate regulon response regulator CusR
VRVLIVERDAAVVRVLERSLRSHGFDVSSASPDQDALVQVKDNDVGMIIFDISPLTDDQWGLLQQLRAEHAEIPLLLIVSAEDCLPKPFAVEELIGRIRKRMRGANEARPTTLVAGELRLDLLARCAWYGERLIELPEREFALLEYFMRHQDRILSRQEILADVWGYDEDPASNVIDVYVRYLRNRLKLPAGRRGFISTVRGEGYRFEVPPPEPVEGDRRDVPLRD